ncbi:MAG: alpha-L-fucosidase [Phycisphaerae bacterium]|nr:alpha-L-fucosidase [Phycisphaerae bacterium]
MAIPALKLTTVIVAILVWTGGCPAAVPEVDPIAITPSDTPEQILTKSVQVRPHPRQIAWQKRELIAFIHFTVNTFTDKEWGEGTEDPKIFNPTELDARQWARVCKEAGIKLIILTAKHHDGFCLWPSAYTEHSVKNSPWKGGKGDVVAELATACKEAGLELGLYLSPWDRHEKSYGDSPRYNEHFCNQLRELLTNYGPVSEVWFDGACGEGPNGKKQVYDWPKFNAVVRELAPNAVIFNGPDVRWVGNESGFARETEWSVVGVKTLDGLGYSLDAQGKDLGSLDILKQSKYMVWYPAETDVSIRPGWFYHASEDSKVKSVKHLLDIYYSSVGRNSLLLLNLPPDRRGLIHENDAARLAEFGKIIRETFKTNLASASKTTTGADKLIDGKWDTVWSPGQGKTTMVAEFDLGGPKTFNCVMVQEFIPEGQRVEEFSVEAWDGNVYKPIAKGTTIGYKRLLRFDNTTSGKVRLNILKSRAEPKINEFGLFLQPAVEQR